MEQKVQESDTFFTHDNGSRPFKVVIEGSKVAIHKKLEDDSVPTELFEEIERVNSQGELETCIKFNVTEDHYEATYPSKPNLTFEAKRVFVGIDVKPDFAKNSALLDLGNNEYVHIGSNVFQFSPLSNIVQYKSPIGNNDVPYPYAIDEQGNYYLIIAEAIVLNRENLKDKMKHYDDPHQWFFSGSSEIISYDRCGQCNSCRSQNALGYSDFYINGNRYTMTAKKDPSQEYKTFASVREEREDNVPEDVPNEGVFVRRITGELVQLSEEEYVKIQTEHAQERHFQILENVELIGRI